MGRARSMAEGGEAQNREDIWTRREEGGRWPSIFHIPFSIQPFYRIEEWRVTKNQAAWQKSVNGANESHRQLVPGYPEPPTDPDNHLNDNCRQRGINCRPRNKLHVPVTASILVTRPPIAALPSPHDTKLSMDNAPTTTTTTTTIAFHEYLSYEEP